jgi:hypothetical protein
MARGRNEETRRDSMTRQYSPPKNSRWVEPSAPMFTFVVTEVDDERERATIQLEAGGIPLHRPFSDFGTVLKRAGGRPF